MLISPNICLAGAARASSGRALLAAALARARIAAGPCGEAVEEVLRAERAADRLGSTQRGGLGEIGVVLEQVGEASGASLEQRRCRDQLVVAARKMRPRARPSPVLRPRNQTRAHRVQRDIARRG